MSKLFQQTFFQSRVTSIGLTAAVLAPAIISAPSLAAFSDTQNHWARPFIETLAEKEIITGYPDGTFRPNQPVQRDEFAAIIRQAFDKAPKRQIASGSVYKDVPSGYWADNAIKEAYEMGFMSGYPGGVFRPNQSITRVDALVSLMRVLDVPATSTTATTTQITPPQRTTRQANRRPRMFVPMMFASLMQPIITQRPAVAATATPTPPSFVVSEYYTDADNIPQYAVDAVGQATQANIVVNHPNVKVLNPTQRATRGDIAAFIHQTLVSQGRIEPLPENVEASKYVVGRVSSATK
jgi:S-layer homology domain